MRRRRLERHVVLALALAAAPCPAENAGAPKPLNVTAVFPGPALTPATILGPSFPGVRQCATSLLAGLSFKEVFYQNDVYARLYRLPTGNAANTAFVFRIFQAKSGGTFTKPTYHLDLACELPKKLASCWAPLGWDAVGLATVAAKAPYKRLLYDLSPLVPNTTQTAMCLLQQSIALENEEPGGGPKPPGKDGAKKPPPGNGDPFALGFPMPPPGAEPKRVTKCFRPELVEASLGYDPDGIPGHRGIEHVPRFRAAGLEAGGGVPWPPMRNLPEPIAVGFEILAARIPPLWDNPRMEVLFADDVPAFDHEIAPPQLVHFPGAKAGAVAFTAPLGDGAPGVDFRWNLRAPKGKTIPLPRFREFRFCGTLGAEATAPDPERIAAVERARERAPKAEVAPDLAAVGSESKVANLNRTDLMLVVGDGPNAMTCLPASGPYSGYRGGNPEMSFYFSSTERQSVDVVIDGLCHVQHGLGVEVRPVDGKAVASGTVKAGATRFSLSAPVGIGRYEILITSKSVKSAAGLVDYDDVAFRTVDVRRP